MRAHVVAQLVRKRESDHAEAVDDLNAQRSNAVVLTVISQAMPQKLGFGPLLVMRETRSAPLPSRSAATVALDVSVLRSVAKFPLSASETSPVAASLIRWTMPLLA